MPSPHSACVHVLGVSVQDQPGSVRQVLEQPSPPMASPSSPFSLPVMTPSPHKGTHGFPGTLHCHPGSTVEQSAEQPSPSAAFMSSQASTLDSAPLPQMTVLMQSCPGVGHSKSCSI